MATQDPGLLVLGVLLKKSIKSAGRILVALVVYANLGLGHQEAHRVLVLNVAERDLSCAVDLSLHQELNQLEEDQVTFLGRKGLIMSLKLGVVNNLDLEVDALRAEVLRNR